MAKMRSGQHSSGVFCSFVFHEQVQRGEILVSNTDHKHVCRVMHKDGFIEYIFWDEADLANPGGATFEEAVESFDKYCMYALGA